MTTHATEIAQGERFAFGANWARFLTAFNDARLEQAEASLRDMLQLKSLKGLRFLDAGSGSGLFSLAASRLGATVHSFDYDPQSVACTREMRRRYAAEDGNWNVEEGSVLDRSYLSRLGQFDIVYSWGVLHHTGSMYRAFANVAPLVAPNGKLFIAIYNDQGLISRYWHAVKQLYNRSRMSRPLLIALHAPYLVGARFFARIVTGRLQLERGMSLWYDCIDWLGGYPFEVATPDQILAFFRKEGFILEKLTTCRGRSGCNEFVFSRAPDWSERR